MFTYYSFRNIYSLHTSVNNIFKIIICLLVNTFLLFSFRLGRVAGATALGGLGILHSQQQFHIVLLATHQDGTKQGRVANQFSPKKARLLTKNRLSYKKARKKARRSHEKSQKKLDLPNHKKADLVTGKANKTNLVTEKNLNADLITGKAN